MDGAHLRTSELICPEQIIINGFISLSVDWYKQMYNVRRTLMMNEKIKMRYVSCPSCGKQLLKVAGNCSVEITCTRCRKEIVGIVDEIYMKLFENYREKEPGKKTDSMYSTDMMAFRQQKKAM